jgi:hypothetical protein
LPIGAEGDGADYIGVTSTPHVKLSVFSEE